MRAKTKTKQNKKKQTKKKKENQSVVTGRRTTRRRRKRKEAASNRSRAVIGATAVNKQTITQANKQTTKTIAQYHLLNMVFVLEVEDEQGGKRNTRDRSNVCSVKRVDE
jgi:hypothetical protein